LPQNLVRYSAEGANARTGHVLLLLAALRVSVFVPDLALAVRAGARAFDCEAFPDDACPTCCRVVVPVDVACAVSDVEFVSHQ